MVLRGGKNQVNNDCPKIDVICSNCAHEHSGRSVDRFFNACHRHRRETDPHGWCVDWKCRASAHLGAINDYNRKKGLIK